MKINWFLYIFGWKIESLWVQGEKGLWDFEEWVIVQRRRRKEEEGVEGEAKEGLNQKIIPLMH